MGRIHFGGYYEMPSLELISLHAGITVLLWAKRRATRFLNAWHGNGRGGRF